MFYSISENLISIAHLSFDALYYMLLHSLSSLPHNLHSAQCSSLSSNPRVCKLQVGTGARAEKIRTYNYKVVALQ